MDLKRRTVFRGDDGEVYKSISPPSGSVKVWKDETEDGVEATHVRVPISSTSEDRDGDEFTEEGLDHMIEQLQSGDVPMFLDHGISPETGFQDYRALEAVGGWKDGEKEDGVVYGIGALDPDHEQAEELSKRLENGVVPVGWSVGFIPHDSEPKTDDEGEREGERFLQHDLLETSAVGIPSNPDGVSASVATAVKGFAEERGVELDAEGFAKSMTRSLEDAIEDDADPDELDEEGDDEDEEEDDVDVETDEGDPDQGEPATLSEDAVDQIASSVGDAVGRELEQHREVMLEQLDAEPAETDEEGDDEDDEEEDDVETDEGDDADDEEEDDDGKSARGSGTPRAIASFGGLDDEQRDADDEETEERTGTPAGPTFNPGTSN